VWYTKHPTWFSVFWVTIPEMLLKITENCYFYKDNKPFKLIPISGLKTKKEARTSK